MDLAALAGVSGIGFVLVAIVVNVVYVRAGLPLPGARQSLDEVTTAFAAIGGALKRPSVLAPVSWLCLTVFGAGLLSTGDGVWALVGFAGVLLQNATFTVVEAVRFGMVAAAAHGRGSVAGLWSFGNVLFGFNQLFLAIALLGFTAAGDVPGWLAGLGYASAAMLFVSSAASPYNSDGTNRISPVGLIGWLGWITWIVAYSVILFTR
jgi:hypothetical protein